MKSAGFIRPVVMVVVGLAFAGGMRASETLMRTEVDSRKKTTAEVVQLATVPSVHLGGGYPRDEDALRLLGIFRNAVRHTVGSWWSARGFVGQERQAILTIPAPDGKLGERAIRPLCEQGFALAVAFRFEQSETGMMGIPSVELKEHSLQLIRSVAARHRANTPMGWGDGWQTGMWAAWCAQSAWLMWDYLTLGEQEMVVRMLVYEADRFFDYTVPNYRNRAGQIQFPGDSKSEENAWNSFVLNTAVCLLPEDPRVSRWREKAIELMLSVYARPSDVKRKDLMHGRAISEWLSGSNSEENGAVINHDIVHPDYIVAGLMEFSPAPLFLLAGQPVPRAAFFNVDQAYRALTEVEFSNRDGTVKSTIYRRGKAELFYPHGNDWGTHRVMNFAFADVFVRAFALDGLSATSAAEWERLHIAAAIAMQARFGDGRSYGAESEDKFHSRDGWVALRAAEGCLIKWLTEKTVFKTSDDAVSR